MRPPPSTFGKEVIKFFHLATLGKGGNNGGGGRKYEKLETDDPAERKRQEATHEEIQRLNFKIVSEVTQ